MELDSEFTSSDDSVAVTSCIEKAGENGGYEAPLFFNDLISVPMLFILYPYVLF